MYAPASLLGSDFSLTHLQIVLKQQEPKYFLLGSTTTTGGSTCLKLILSKGTKQMSPQATRRNVQSLEGARE